MALLYLRILLRFVLDVIYLAYDLGYTLQVFNFQNALFNCPVKDKGSADNIPATFVYTCSSLYFDAYVATKETPRLYIPIFFKTKVSENKFLI